MILADTSVWIDHFRSYNPKLAPLLEENEVVVHDFVIGELASGNFKNRQATLEMLRCLPSIKTARHGEVMHLLEAHRLHGCGVGWVDLHLLASAKLSGSLIFTLDRGLNQAAKHLRVAAL